MIKKIIFSIVKYLFFGLFVASIVLMIIVLCSNYPSNNPLQSITSITSIFTCITATASLYLSSEIRKENLENTIKERQKDISQKWFDKIIIEKHFDNIFSFYKTCNKLVEELKELNSKSGNMNGNQYDKKVKEKIVAPFTKGYTSLQQELVADLSVLDKNLSNDISNTFSGFQDTFLNYLNIRHPDYDQIKSTIINSQKELLRLLKEYNTMI